MSDNWSDVKREDQHRTTNKRAVALSADGQLAFRNEHKTTITGEGILTEETKFSLMTEGEHFTDISQIAGYCEDCRSVLTSMKKKYCFYCGKINCMKCSHWDEADQRWICPECRKAIRRKRFWAAVGKILSAPFRKKVS